MGELLLPATAADAGRLGGWRGHGLNRGNEKKEKKRERREERRVRRRRRKE